MLKENKSEISVVKEDYSRLLKIFDINKIKEPVVRHIEENYNLLSDVCISFFILSEIHVFKSLSYVILSREYYRHDLEELI